MCMHMEEGAEGETLPADSQLSIQHDAGLDLTTHES